MGIVKLIAVPAGNIVAVHSERLKSGFIIKIEGFVPPVIGEDTHGITAGRKWCVIRHGHCFLLLMDPDIMIILRHTKDAPRDLHGPGLLVDGKAATGEIHRTPKHPLIAFFDIPVQGVRLKQLTGAVFLTVIDKGQARIHVRVPQPILIETGDIVAVNPQFLELRVIIEIDLVLPAVIAKDQHVVGSSRRAFQKRDWFLIFFQPVKLPRVAGSEDSIRYLDGPCRHVQRDLSILKINLLSQMGSVRVCPVCHLRRVSIVDPIHGDPICSRGDIHHKAVIKYRQHKLILCEKPLPCRVGFHMDRSKGFRLSLHGFFFFILKIDRPPSFGGKFHFGAVLRVYLRLDIIVSVWPAADIAGLKEAHSHQAGTVGDFYRSVDPLPHGRIIA